MALKKLKPKPPEPAPKLIELPRQQQKKPIVARLPTEPELLAMIKAAKIPKPLYVIQHPTNHIRAFWRGPKERGSILLCCFLNSANGSHYTCEPGGQLNSQLRDAIKRGTTRTIMGVCPKELL